MASGNLFAWRFHFLLLLWTWILLFWVSETYHFAGLVLQFSALGVILPALGTPWRTIGAAGPTRGGLEPGFYNCGVIFGVESYQCENAVEFLIIRSSGRCWG